MAELRRYTKVVEADLRYKHRQMKADPFLFFRATFYRWAQRWPEHCPELARGPRVLTVGDLHIENFGTWRDAEGRLAWGVNDFDEAYPMAFTNDLVRLAVSTLLAADAAPNFRLTPAEICTELTEGYRDAVEHGGEPFVLMEQHPKLRRMALQGLRQPAEFWRRLELKTQRDLVEVARIGSSARLSAKASRQGRAGISDGTRARSRRASAAWAAAVISRLS